MRHGIQITPGGERAVKSRYIVGAGIFPHRMTGKLLNWLPIYGIQS